MSTVAILNVILALLIVTAIVSLLGWSVVADKALAASRRARAVKPARGTTRRPSLVTSPRTR